METRIVGDGKHRGQNDVWCADFESRRHSQIGLAAAKLERADRGRLGIRALGLIRLIAGAARAGLGKSLRGTVSRHRRAPAGWKGQQQAIGQNQESNNERTHPFILRLEVEKGSGPA